MAAMFNIVAAEWMPPDKALLLGELNDAEKARVRELIRAGTPEPEALGRVYAEAGKAALIKGLKL